MFLTYFIFYLFLGKSARFAYSYFPFLCVYVCVSVSFVTTVRVLAKIKYVKNDVCRLRYSPSKYVTAKIVVRDLDLFFVDKK